MSQPIESLAARMKHWRSGDPLERTSLAWFLHVTQQIEIARAKAKAAKYAPRLVVLPIAGDPPPGRSALDKAKP